MCFSLGLSCMRHPGLPGFVWLFPSPFQESFQIYFPQIFSHDFLSSSPSGMPMIQILQCLTFSRMSLILSSEFLSFFFFSFCFSCFYHSMLQLTYLFSLNYSTVGSFQSIFLSKLLCCSLLIIYALILLCTC